MPELVWLWLLLFSLFLSSLIAWRYGVKGRKIDLSLIGITTGGTLVRGLVFFGVLYLPLIDQPKMPYTTALPITGTITVL